MPRSPAQTWARIIGWALLLTGVIGFFYSSSFGSPGDVDAVFGVFAVNGFHNVVHVLTGALGIAMARSWGGARVYCLLLAASYALVTIWGTVVGDGGEILSIVPVNTEDNVLHAAIALGSLIAAFAASPVPRPSSREPGPGFRFN